MATKKRSSIPLADTGIDWTKPAGEFIPSQKDVAPAEEQAGSGMLRRTLGDTAVSAVKSAIGVPETLVGMADMVTGGRAGKLVQDAGVDFKAANEVADTLYSPEYQAASKKVQGADGIVDTLRAAFENPSTIYHGAVTSLGSMLTGAPVGKAAMLAGTTMAGRAAIAAAPAAERGAMLAATTRTPGWVAGALSEGASSAGQNLEQVRQGTADGLLTAEQIGVIGASGALTAGITAVAGRVANKLGIGDINQMIAGAQRAGPEVQKGLARTLAEGFATEGLLQEFPQSWQEQVAQNIATGKPWADGAANAAVMGGLSGGLLGAGAAPFGRGEAAPVVDPGAAIRATKQPEGGPMTRAANAAIEAQAQAADAGTPSLPALSSEQEQAALAAIEAQGGKDAKGLRQFAAAANSAAGARPTPTAQPVQGMPTAGPSATVVDAPFSDRLLTLREQLGDEATRQALRAQFGDDALNQATYYANIADRPDVLKGVDRTRDNMLALAERMVSMALLKPINRPGVESDSTQAAQLEGPGAGPAQIGLDTTMTGRMRVDAAGNAAPETRADAINTQQAAAGMGADERQARKASAVNADPAPAAGPKPAGQPALGYDTTPTGRMRAGSEGVAPETAADAINTRQAQGERDAEAQRKADLGLTPDVQAVQDRNALGRSMPGDLLNPKGEPFKHERAAITAQKKAKGGTVLQVAGGWVVRPESATVEPANAQGQETAAVPTAPVAPAQQEGTDRAGAAPAEAATSGAAGSAGRDSAGVEADGLKAGDQVSVLNGKGEARHTGKFLGKNDAGTGARVELAGGEVVTVVAGRVRKIEPATAEPSPATAPATGEPGNAAAPVEADSGSAAPAPAAAAPTAAKPEKAVERRNRLKAERAAPAPAPAPDTRKAEMRPYRREDGSIGYEAVPINPPAAPASSTTNETPPATQGNADKPGPAKPEAAPGGNKLVSEDAAEKARAIIKAKLRGNTLNSGIDPELLQAGITLAAYHVERGARKFAAYARAMVDDLGDVVKPYLQSWYMAMRSDPTYAAMRADMDKASAVEDLDVDEVLATTAAATDTSAGEDAIKQPQSDEDVTMSGDVLMHADESALDMLAGYEPDAMSQQAKDDVANFVDGERARDVAMFGQQPVRKSFPRAKGDGKGGPLQLPPGVEVMGLDEAKAKVDGWKAEAERQWREESNHKYGVLSLFDTTGVMAQPWIDAGYTVYTYDLQDGQDINEFDAQNLLEQHGNDNIMVVIGQPPCTDFASSGAQWWKDKDATGQTEASNELVRQMLRTVELFRPAVWAMENPVGRIAKLNKLPKPTAAFDPWHFGDDYTKRTQFFGRFNPDMPTAQVFPTRGSIIHKMSSSAQKERSDTPEGIAYAFFMANNFAGMGPAGRLAAEYAGVDRALFDAAVAAGKTEYDIKSAIDDSYYENDLETVRDELRAMASTPPPKSAIDRRNRLKAERAAMAGDPKATKAVEPAPATHKDPGEPTEPVTPAVVREAIKTGVQATDRKPGELKADLLAQIDAAMGKAPSEADIDGDIVVGQPKTNMGRKEFDGFRKFGGRTTNLSARESGDGKWTVTDTSYDGSGTGKRRNKVLDQLIGTPAVVRGQMAAMLRRIDGAGKLGEPDTVTFSVPGDGVFKVLNVRERLAEFRRKVENSPGFKAQRPGPIESPRVSGRGAAFNANAGAAFGVEDGSGSKVAAFDNMVNEGDLEAASDYADAVGLELDPKKLANATKVLKWRDTRPAEAAPAPAAEAPAAAPEPTDRRRKAAEYMRQAVTKRTNANSAMVWQIIGPDGNPVSGPPGKYPGNDGPLAGSATMGNLGWGTKREADAALAELSRKADGILGAAPAAEPAPAETPAEADEEAPQLSEAQARKQFEWRDMGQSGSTKTHRLFFYLKPEDKGTGRAMGRGYVELYEGSSGWRVDGEGESFKALADAKKAAVEAAIPVLREQGWIEPAEAVAAAPDAAAVPAAPTNTEDAGAELTYNRRNRIKSGIKWADIASKNDALKVKEAVKQNVYPRPDYQALVDGGMQPLVAHLVKQAYDAIAAKPNTRGVPTDAELQAYIVGVNRVMAGVLAWANDPVSLSKWAAREARSAGAMLGKSVNLSELAPGSGKSMLESAYPEGWKNNQAEVLVLGGNKMWGALQPGYEEARRAGKAVEAGWPASQEAWEKRGIKIINAGKIDVSYYEGERSRTEQPYVSISYKVGQTRLMDQLIDGAESKDDPKVKAAVAAELEANQGMFIVMDKARRIVGKQETEEAAKGVARELTKRDGKDGGPDDSGIDVALASREGPPRRMDGENVSSDQLKEAFGFKGVNFGNWMKGDAPALRAERQAHLNHAYDSFADMADLFGMPAKAMSLNGMLGLAIGAQGNGKYAAHFVPGVNEINLTRTSGAGSLAHEWGHALDHYFAEQAGFAKRDEPFLTEHTTSVVRKVVVENGRERMVVDTDAQAIRPEIVARFKAIVQAMNRKPETLEQFNARQERSKETAKSSVSGWLKSIRRDYVKAGVDEAAVDAIAARIMALDLGDGKIMVSPSLAVHPVVDELRALYRKRAGRVPSIDQIKGLQSNLDYYAYAMSEKPGAVDHVPQQISTDYANAAAGLDKDKGGKRYWSTNLEKFARAFDAFVSDELEAKAAKNTYLSHAGRTGETVPMGDERTTINAAIKALVGEIKTREDDAGNVAMFSRAQGQQQPASNRRKAVEALVAQIAARWTNAPEVVVVDSMDDPRVPEAVRRDEQTQQSKASAGAPEGFFHGGKVYLVAGQLGGDADVVRVLFHEFGHAGLRVLFGPQLSTILTRLAVLNASKVRAKAAQYGLDYDKPAERRAAAEEVLAEMAEKNPSNGWVKQAVAAIRSFLRAHVPGFSKMRFSDAELVRAFVRPALDYVAGNPAMPVKTNRAQLLVDKGGADAKPLTDGGIAEVLMKQGAQALNVDQRLEVMARVFGALQDLKVFEAVVGLDAVDVVNDIIDAKLSTRGDRDNHAVFLERLAVKLNGPVADQVRVIDALFPAVHGAAKKLAPAETGADGFFGVVSAATTGAYKQLAADAARKLDGRHIVTPTSDGLLGGEAASTASPPPSVSASAVEKNSAMFSRASMADAVRNFSQAGARNAFLDAVTTHGGTNLWGRTVGTQYHKAQANPTTFGRVFDAVQDYIKDTSVFANRAADLAPSLLPKLDSWVDLKKGGLLHHGAKPADTAKAGEAIFRGTLDKVLYDDATLRSQFGLNDLQVGLYKEFRQAVDESLDGMTKTEILRLAGEDGRAVRAAVLAAPDAESAAEVLTAHLTELAELTANDDLLGTVDRIGLKVKRLAQLQDEGYAPLMRFGKHTLHVTRPDGGTEFFGMYESVREANNVARLMRADPAMAGMGFAQGVMSQEGHKLFNGMSLDALELFADATDNAQNPVYQEYLKLALSNRSAMKRMIERKAIKGYSEDVARVLASFVTSNARMSAGHLHLTDAKKAAEAIPKETGDLRDDAINLVEYVTNPAEEAAAVRGLLFTSFIGGSVASALVNLTQPITMTLPYLTQWGGAKAGKRMLAAAGMVASGKGMDADLRAALERAEQDGIVSPQEIHHLQAEAMATMSNKFPVLKKVAFVWGSMFSLAEQFNRRVSFVAAYQTAQQEGIADPFAFAEKAVVETQGLYNKGNKANLARGAVGATVMTFKQFSTHYLEFLTRMAKSGPEGRKAVAVALALLLLTAGAGGLPFADDLDDLIDTLGQFMGHDTNSKRWKRQFIAQTLGLGDDAAEVATRGITALPGMPVDLSLRMGLGNLLPATGLFLRSNTDTGRQLMEVAGAAGGLAANVMDVVKNAAGGDVVGGVMNAMPFVAVQNMAKAVQMWDTGEYRNKKGQKVMNVDAVDGAMKFIGFQPAAVARESSRIGETMRTVQLAKNVEGEIAGRWAQGMADGDREAVASARQELADWNKANPQAPIRITMPQVLARLKVLKTSRAERTVKQTPKELRPLVAETLK